jgi:hypothetical protein
MTAAALALRNRPIGDDGMGPQGPPPHPNPTPTKTLRIGHAPRFGRFGRVSRIAIRLACAVQWTLLIALMALPLMIRSHADDSGRHEPSSPEESLIHEIDQAQLRDQLAGGAR